VSALTKEYRVNPVARLHWVGWDNEYVVFEETSGQTHELDPLRAFILNAAIVGPVQVQSLLDDLVTEIPSAASDISLELLSKVVEEFETVGLLESEPV
jgi:PqqD family protein of HPr-rel-A system